MHGGWWWMVLAGIVSAGVKLGCWCYGNTHWWVKEMRRIEALGVQERQAVLANGHVINYAELGGEGPALLLIHGQMSAWQDYAAVMPQLSQQWHVYAVDVYGHGGSSHEEALYYLNVNGEDLIAFIEQEIGAPVVVSGHSNGALLAAYMAAYGGRWVRGALLEDPPVFSTEGEDWEKTFAYIDTYAPLHAYLSSPQEACWPAYYLRHCYWGQLFMKPVMPFLANYAQWTARRHPDEEVKMPFLPRSITCMFHHVGQYDMLYGEHFYDLTWSRGVRHAQMLADIAVPCVYLHAKETVSPEGVLFCAASRAQAERAVALIGDDVALIETPDSDHNIHGKHTTLYLEALSRLL